MRKHLLTKHEIDVPIEPSWIQAQTLEKLQQLYMKAKDSGETEEIDNQVFLSYLDKDVVIEALVSLIVSNNLSHRLVESPDFHVFCQVLNPKANDVVPQAHSTVGKQIIEAFSNHKDVIRKKLQSALTHIHLSMDIWTAPNNLLMLGITADFVDCEDEKHTKALIALPEVDGHSGEDQFKALLPVLQDYSIVRKVGAVIGDNSGTNDTLSRAIQRYLVEEEGIKWEATRWRTRCLGHIINLAVQAFLFFNTIDIEKLESYDEMDERGELSGNKDATEKFRLLGPLGKLHNILVYSRSQSALEKEFIELAGRMVPLDNRTR